MAETMSYPQQEALPGVEWPEPLQPELQLEGVESAFDQWSEEEILKGLEMFDQAELPIDMDALKSDFEAYLDTLDMRLSRQERTGKVDPALLRRYEALWDYTINKGWATSYDELEIVS